MSNLFRVSAVLLAVLFTSPVLAQTAKIKHPGADGVWGTADDTERMLQRDPAFASTTPKVLPGISISML